MISADKIACKQNIWKVNARPFQMIRTKQREDGTKSTSVSPTSKFNQIELKRNSTRVEIGSINFVKDIKRNGTY